MDLVVRDLTATEDKPPGARQGEAPNMFETHALLRKQGLGTLSAVALEASDGGIGERYRGAADICAILSLGLPDEGITLLASRQSPFRLGAFFTRLKGLGSAQSGASGLPEEARAAALHSESDHQCLGCPSRDADLFFLDTSAEQQG